MLRRIRNCRGIIIIIRDSLIDGIRLILFIHLQAQGLSKRDQHPQTLLMGYGTVYFFVAKQQTLKSKRERK